MKELESIYFQLDTTWFTLPGSLHICKMQLQSRTSGVPTAEAEAIHLTFTDVVTTHGSGFG